MLLLKKTNKSLIFSICIAILLCSIVVAAFTATYSAKKVDAVTNYSNTTQIGSITLAGYESRSDGFVFDGEKMQELYNALLGKENSTLDDIKTAIAGGNLDSSDFRTNNPNKNDVIVEIGGLKWAAVYLALNNSTDQEPVLTFWLADSSQLPSSYRASVYNDYNNNIFDLYPANLYSKCKLRAVALNNGGDYATSPTELNGHATQDPKNPFAIYTMPNSAEVSGSLIDFIETPEKVYWQETEECKKSGISTYNYENDAWSKNITSFSIGKTYYMDTLAYYENWKYDKLWIPGFTEIGWSNIYSGLWDRSMELYNNSANYWLRTASTAAYKDAGNQAGKGISVTTSMDIRPAFHLNLNKANEKTTVTAPVQGKKVKAYYDDGIGIDFEMLGIDPAKVSITCNGVGADGNALPSGSMTYTTNVSAATFTAAKVGKYTVQVEPTGSYTWTSGGVTPKEYTFKIVDRVQVPTFLGTPTEVYAGSNIEFKFSASYDSAKVTIATVTSGLTYDVTIGDYGGLKAKNVGFYKATATLKNTELMEWTDTTTAQKTLDLSITPFAMTLDFEPSKVWSWANGEQQTVSIVDQRFAGDVLSYELAYEDSSGLSVPLSGTIDKDNPNKVNIIIPPLSNGNYTFKVVLSSNGASKNYTLSGNTTRSISITNKDIVLSQADIQWQYQNVNIDEGNLQNIGVWNVSDAPLEYDYNAGEYILSIDASTFNSLGVTIDKYTNETGKACGTYTTTVSVVPMNASSTINGKSSETFSIKWKINQGLYDLSGVYWDYTDGDLQYTGRPQSVTLKGLLSTLVPQYSGNSNINVGDNYVASIVQFVNSDSNFKDPDISDPSTYKYKDGENFPWTLNWRIAKKAIVITWQPEEATDSNGRAFTHYVVGGDDADKVGGYLYYRGDDYSTSGGGTATGSPIKFDDITVVEKQVDNYWVVAVLDSAFSDNYEITSGKARFFSVGSTNDEVRIELNGGNHKFIYDGNAHGNELKVTASALTVNDINKKYYQITDGGEVLLEDAPINAGKYLLVMSLSEADEEDFVLSTSRIEFEIEKVKITAVWDMSGQVPVISNLDDTLKEIVGYIYYDAEGNQLEDGVQLEVGKSYSVKAILKGEYGENYEFVAEDGETVLEDPKATEEEKFTVKDGNNGDGNGIGGIGSGNQGGNGSMGDILDKLKDLPLWQIIVSAVSVILMIAFLAKIVSSESKRKKANKKIDKYSAYYAGAFLGLSFANWTVIACSLAGGAIVCLIGMIIATRRQSNAEDELDEVKEEYEKNQRKEEMRMMFMGMSGGQGGSMGGGGYVVQQGLGAEEIRGIVSDTMTALLPGMQQMLPQQASSNDEVIKSLVDGQRVIMQKLSEQPIERVVEKEVVATTANDDTIKQMMKTQENLMHNQEKLMEKILELSVNQKVETQVVEKVVEPTEKVVEKIVEVPIEKIVEVPVEVEKIVEKEVRVEVPVEVEKIVEVPVEKVVEKVVEKEVKATAPAKAPKERAARLTLDEAYAKLTKTQQKYFDSLREYALTKDKCKEKKSTYFILLGQSSVNPLIKLTIKKDTTVALFKMEDEYLKDIRKDATNDGTKVKVKETEVVVSDAQACKVAKNMIDLREDQIERYQDLLREQRSMRNKK